MEGLPEADDVASADPTIGLFSKESFEDEPDSHAVVLKGKLKMKFRSQRRRFAKKRKGFKGKLKLETHEHEQTDKTLTTPKSFPFILTEVNSPQPECSSNTNLRIKSS